MGDEVDEITATAPSSSSYREGVSLWLWDDAGRFAFPRIGVEAVGATWDTSFATALCMAYPDGELIVDRGDHEPHPVTDAAGRPRILGAGPLRFTCVEPFTRWRVDFDGEALRLHVEASMVLPPWFQNTQDPEGHQVVGEHRHEQLCTVTGAVEIDGNELSFTGGGLRIHRKGGVRNDYDDWYGHVWQSARFASGRAFGHIHYHPRPDGTVKYREGWVHDGGDAVPAKAEHTPWMTDPQSAGEDVSVTLRTAKGLVEIEGETLMANIRPPRPTAEGTTFPILQSAIARYRWGDEEAYGMVERSLTDPALLERTHPGSAPSPPAG